MLERQNREYNQFCEDNGLKRRAERIATAQWDRKQAKASIEAAKPYIDITNNWYQNATPNSHDVQDLQAYTVNGVTYTVDGRNVQLKYSAHEKEIAELLKEKVGGEIYMVPKVNIPQGISTPDYIFNSNPYDLKAITGKGKKILYDRISKKKEQSENFIFDISESPLKMKAIREQIDYIYKSKHTAFVNEVVIIKDGEIRIVVKRQ